MNESDFEDIVLLALKEYAKSNDLPMGLATVREKGFGEEAGILVKVGDSEFHLAIHQTVFEGDESV